VEPQYCPKGTARLGQADPILFMNPRLFGGEVRQEN
jgi:hypothetical protein